MTLFKLNKIIHRDIGYFTAFFLLIFSISGIAVNHIDSWNPNYIVEIVEFEHDFVAFKGEGQEINRLRKLVKIPKEKFRNYADLGNGNHKVFFENSSLTLNIKTSKVILEKVKKRPLIYYLNFLHLNHPKKLWTYLSDFFAILLIYLSLSGLFMIRGKKGFLFRGMIISILGTFLVVFFLFIYS